VRYTGCNKGAVINNILDMEYVWMIVVGGVAGMFASLITSSKNGIISSVILGIIGGLFGSWLFGYFGISLFSGVVGDILTAAIGAVILISVARIFTR
jgi:uncharacterized membrane protein YeaQ/YmgE (transglycosylase-associated protein family)